MSGSTTPKPEPAADATRSFESAGAAQETASQPSLIGRLFIVPAVIVSLMICLAIVVVLFGGLGVGPRATIDELLKTIESGSGRHTAGVMLLPPDREVWQAAQELALRLQRRDQELTAAELEPTAARIAQILKNLPAVDAADDGMQPKRLFLIAALARLGVPSAAPIVAGHLGDSDARMRQAALSGLVEMRALPEARAQAERVIPLLDDSAPEVQMVACVALGALGDADQANVVRALRGKLEGDREIQWNAALALARLGHPACKLVLLNMLDRGYWERNRVQYVEASRSVDRPLSSTEVANYLTSAIEAGARINDGDIRRAIEKLASDASAQVREAAKRGLDERRGASAAMVMAENPV